MIMEIKLEIMLVLKNCSAMCKKFFRHTSLAFYIISVIFTFIPESFFKKGFIFECNEINKYGDFVVIINRVSLFIAIFIIVKFCMNIYRKCRRRITIERVGYSIHIEYGDLFSNHDGKRVITFDECFSTDIGEKPHEINPTSICGQYIKNNNIKNEHIYKLIEHYGIKAAKKKSLFQSKIRYESGTLVPNGEDLLLAFAKLDKDGLGYMSYDEFIDCLRLLWKEINKYYGENDVYIPILGSGVTRMGNESLTQQKLLDIIIKSYSLSQYKLKLPCKLHIICKEREGFSLNEIEDY